MPFDGRNTIYRTSGVPTHLRASMRPVAVGLQPGDGTLEFLNDGEYSDAAHAAALNLAAAGSLEIYIKPSPLGQTHAFPLIVCKGAVNTAYGILLDTGAGNIICRGVSATVLFSINFAITAGIWTHTAMGWDSTTIEACKNGVTAGSTGMGAMDTNAGVLRFGDSNLTPGNAFHGGVAYIRLWSVRRSAAQFLANMNVDLPASTPNLVAYWRCLEGSGATLVDAVAGRNSTIVGTPHWTVSRPF